WTICVKKDGYDDRRTYTKQQVVHILLDSLPALFMPVLIVGGIRLGIFTPTEAGAFAVVYALLISLFVYREMKLKDLANIFLEGAKSTGIVMFIVAAASAVGWLITVAQIPAKVVEFLAPLIAHPLALLLVINLFLFIMGMIMDLTPNILIFGPILVPVVQAAGIDPIVFGVIMVLNLTIGLITPPVGTVLYLGCSIADISFARVVKGVLPFLLTEIIALLLFTIFPQLISVPMGWLT
ncbi:MAG: TRAP transporter large permease, partial [Clostridiales bacterium]|nr:TRAP transporter large permease [Clostridiales bacterium]